MIPTIPVTATLHDQSGNPLAGAKISATLTRDELYQGIVVPQQVAQHAPTAGARKPGDIFLHAGTTAPAGALICPVAQTNLSRAAYPALHAKLAADGYPWGAGDGATTFGMPWYPAGYAPIQANGNVGTQTVGQLIAHAHTVPATSGAYGGTNTASTVTWQNGIGISTSTNGGSANLAAGVATLICVQYQ